MLELVDRIAANLLRLAPESATSLGIDTGDRAALRSQLTDRSADGQRRIASQVREDLERVRALDTAPLTHAMRTTVEVVRSAYATALEGFALPYGDITVGGWRNTPYVVIQNVGAYLDVPRFLDSDHPLENATDADAYLARLQSYARQLDGELGRMQAARGAGLVPPAFLIDKALDQMRVSAKNAGEGGSLVESIARRTKNIAGDWAGRARTIAQTEVAPALERQIAELQAERKVASDDAGMWARPRGEEFYRWALKAATTTDMTPDEVHELGHAELKRLHGEMDVILKGAGYSKGTVGERMRALDEDPRYRFAEGDEGRAEILAFIQNRLDWIRSQMPRAFSTLVDPKMEVRRLPPEEEPGAPTAYGGPGSIDGKIPGRFWINLRTTSLHSKFGLADLTFHESIPGHIWQGEYTHRMPLARQLLSFSAYRKGGRSTRSSWPTSSAPMPTIPLNGSDTCRGSRSAPAAWSWTPAFTPSAGRASRACGSSSMSTAPIRSRWPAKSIAIVRGRGRRAATRWGTPRSTGSANGRTRRSDRDSTSNPSTTPWCSAVTCRWTSSRRTWTNTSRRRTDKSSLIRSAGPAPDPAPPLSSLDTHRRPVPRPPRRRRPAAPSRW